MRLILSIPYLAGIAFCGYGLLATLEPGEGAFAWRLIYGGLLALLSLGLIKAVRRRDS